jgi:ribosomal protein S27E
MFIVIPSGTTHTATVRGSVEKGVRCENCGHDYVYTLTREAIGADTALFVHSRAQEKALAAAKAKLQRRLEMEHDDVPCPMCRHHQPHLAKSARQVLRAGLYPELLNLSFAFFLFAGATLGFLAVLCVITLCGSNPTLPAESTVRGFVIAAGVIAAPGLLLRGLRWLLMASS